MNIKTYLPSETLSPFVKEYKIIESQDELVNRVLPNTSLTIAFRYKGQVNYLIGDTCTNLPVSVISGLRRKVRYINYLKGTATIIVMFKETGAISFFKEPIYELFEQSVSLDYFMKRQKVSDVEEQLAGAEDDSQRVSIIEQFLISALHHQKYDKLVSTALQSIYDANGLVRIKELTDTLCISQDAFEKRFKRTTGSSPKQFSSIVRMKSIIGIQQQNKRFSHMALDAGFFDQPHFNKEFKLFTGQSPTDFFKSPSFW